MSVLRTTSPCSNAPSKIAGTPRLAVSSRVVRIACSSPREPSTSTPPGNKSRASSPTSRPCSMMASLAASFSAASSGSCTSQYSLLRHCTPATNLDFEIFIRRPVHRLELQQVFAPAVQAGETSVMAVGSLVRVLAWQVHLRHDLAHYALVLQDALVGEQSESPTFRVIHNAPARGLFIFHFFGD